MLTVSTSGSMGGVDISKGRRKNYHHGDLRNALVAAATELARAGGPEAIVLREAARRVGVSATAAYRHFENHGDLLEAVKRQAHEALADRMEEAIAQDAAQGAARATDAGDAEDAGERAERRLYAASRGYLAFAVDEPGLYRAAFHADAMTHKGPGPPPSRAYAMMSETLDALAACGRMPAHRRPYAEIGAWAAVHGLALLIIDGALRNLPADQGEEAVERALDLLAAGLRSP